MIRLSPREYVFLVRPGSSQYGFGPGYLYIDGDVSSFMLGSLQTLEQQMQQILSFPVSESAPSEANGKDCLSLWHARLSMAVTLCRSCKYRYEKIDACGLQRKRNRAGIVGKKFTVLDSGCEWLCSEGEFGDFLARRKMYIVCYGDITDSLQKWLDKVEARFLEVLPEWGPDSDRYYEAVLQVLDKAGSTFGVPAVLLSASDVDWLKARK